MVDPATKARYFAVRGGPDNDHGFVEGDLLFLLPEVSQRVFVYYPAPPTGVDKVDVELRGTAKVHGVPIT